MLGNLAFVLQARLYSCSQDALYVDDIPGAPPFELNEHSVQTPSPPSWVQKLSVLVEFLEEGTNSLFLDLTGFCHLFQTAASKLAFLEVVNLLI